MKIRNQVLTVISIIMLLLNSCKMTTNKAKAIAKGDSISTQEKIKITKTKNKEKMIALMVKAQNCKFKLLINDVVVLEETVGGVFSFGNGIEHHLVKGENKIEVLLDSPENEETSFLAEIVLLDPKKEQSTWDVYKKIESNSETKGILSVIDFFNVDKLKKKENKKDAMLFIGGINCEIEVEINDLPIEKKVIGDAFTSLSIPVESYIANGENIIKIKVIPSKKGKSSLDVKLASVGRDNASFFDESSWDEYVMIKEEEISDIKKYIKKFDIKRKNKLTWETAPKIKLDKKTINKIDTFLEKVHTAMTNKKGEDISYLYKYYRQDMKSINSKYDIKSWEAIDIEGINERKEPLIELKKGNYKLVANGKLIACVGADKLPLIRCKPQNNYMWKQPMYIGLVDDEFYILLR